MTHEDYLHAMAAVSVGVGVFISVSIIAIVEEWPSRVMRWINDLRKTVK